MYSTKSEQDQFEIVRQFDYGDGIFKSLQIFSTSHLPIYYGEAQKLKFAHLNATYPTVSAGRPLE
jgi:hypothetical protein